MFRVEIEMKRIQISCVIFVFSQIPSFCRMAHMRVNVMIDYFRRLSKFTQKDSFTVLVKSVNCRPYGLHQFFLFTSVFGMHFTVVVNQAPFLLKNSNSNDERSLSLSIQFLGFYLVRHKQVRLVFVSHI